MSRKGKICRGFMMLSVPASILYLLSVSVTGWWYFPIVGMLLFGIFPRRSCAMFHLPTTTCPLLYILHVICSVYVLYILVQTCECPKRTFINNSWAPVTSNCCISYWWSSRFCMTQTTEEIKDIRTCMQYTVDLYYACALFAFMHINWTQNVLRRAQKILCLVVHWYYLTCFFMQRTLKWIITCHFLWLSYSS